MSTQGSPAPVTPAMKSWAKQSKVKLFLYRHWSHLFTRINLVTFLLWLSLAMMPYFNYYKEKKTTCRLDQNYNWMATCHTGHRCAYTKLSPSPPAQPALRRPRYPGMTSWFTSHTTSATKTEAGVVQELVAVFWINAMPKQQQPCKEVRGKVDK